MAFSIFAAESFPTSSATDASQFWRISSNAPPSGLAFTAMLRTSSMNVFCPSRFVPVNLRFMARSASITTNLFSMA